MSPISPAAQRRRSCLLATTFLDTCLVFGVSAAKAQQARPGAAADRNHLARRKPHPGKAQNRPGNQARAAWRRSAAPTSRPNAAPSGGAATTTCPAVRQFSGIVGASTSVITAEDIAHSPAQTVQEIIAQTPGVQLTSLYGGVNGVKTSVDLRGFGAFATSNTLVLINGRRLNDIDMAGVDFSTIPRDSIERIEITKGNSGAVLYGDNAVGGVINIVLKNGVGGPPVAMRAEGGVGSFNSRMASVSAATNYGPWSTSFYGNGIKSDGYRVNNALDQRNGVGNLNYTTPGLTAFVTLSGDDQKLGFPGGRLVDPSIGLDELVTNRRGTSTPFDYGNQQGANATAGFTKTLMNGVDLIVDGGVRDKKQQAAFFNPFGNSYVDAHLQTWSITPRLSIKNVMFGMPSAILTGIDYYDATFHQERPTDRGAPPIHTYDLHAADAGRLLAANHRAVADDGFFLWRAGSATPRLSARDIVYNDPNCAGFFSCGAQDLPLDSQETQYALHIGLEHRFNNVFSVFGRAARAFRTPNVDERLSSGPAFDRLLQSAFPATSS